jgi:hypothetical protein
MASFFDLVASLQSSIDDLDQVLSGDENETVLINGVNKDTISKAIQAKFTATQAMVNGRLAFETKALMNADTGQTSNTIAEVWNDSTPDNNGLYGFNGSNWLKSPYDVIAELSRLDARIKSTTSVLYSHGLSQLNNEFPNGNLAELSPGVNLDPSIVVNGNGGNDVIEKIINSDLNAMGIDYMVRLAHVVTNRHYVAQVPKGGSGQYITCTWITYSPTGDHGGEAAYTGINNGLGNGTNGATKGRKGFVDFGVNCRLHWAQWQYWAFTGQPGDTAQVWVGSTNLGHEDNVGYIGGFNFAVSDSAVEYSDTQWNSFIEKGLAKRITDANLKNKTDLNVINSALSDVVFSGENAMVKNAVTGRYGGIDSAPPSNWGGRGLLTYQKNQLLQESGGHRSVIRAVSNTVASYYPLIGVRVGLADLAAAGIIPDDNTPPLISIKGCFSKAFAADHKPAGQKIFFLLRYGNNSGHIYNSSQDVLFNSASGNASYLGSGDSSWAHTAGHITTDEKNGFYHEGVPLPATYKGQPLTAIIINLLGFPAEGYTGETISLEAVDFAVIPGPTISKSDSYLNMPDDFPQLTGIKGDQLDPLFLNSLALKGGLSTNLITIKNSDKVVLLGDSYTASHYTQKDKAYISRLSELTDWRIDNFSRSGDDYAEINQRILLDAPEYHGSLSFKDYGATYALLISFTNDTYHRSSDKAYFFDNVRRIIETVQACGAKPIVSTEFVAGSMFEFAGLSAIARESNAPFFDIMSNAKLFDTSHFSQYWGGGHPATRSNGVFYDPLLPLIDELPRPKQSIKLFRNRPGVTLLRKADLLYDNIAQRVKPWQEITVGHHALVERLAPYYDRLNDIAADHGGYSYNKHQSEYLQLQNNESVDFGDHMLVEVILPTTAARCSDVILNFGVSDAKVYVRNALLPTDWSGYTKFQAFEVSSNKGMITGDVYASNGKSFTIIAEVVDHDGTALILATDYTWANSSAGTLTKTSGTGPATVSFNAARYGFDPLYYADLHKPRGEWLAVDNVDGAATISGSMVQKAMNYDKVVFMVERVSALVVNNINVEWVGAEGKTTHGKPRLRHAAGASQLLNNNSFATMTGWDLTGSVAPTVPHDGVLPLGMTKLVKINAANRISQTFSLTNADRYSGFIDVVVWARRYPAHFNPDINETTAATQYKTAPITSNTCDYSTLTVQLGNGDKREAALINELVGLHWKECRVRLDIGSANILYGSPVVEIFSPDDELEIALVEVWK